MAAYAWSERRCKPRLYERFRATVHGVDAAGEPFMSEAELDNISSGGLYLRLPHHIEAGSELLIVSKLSRPDDGHNSGPLVAVSGTVTRAEQGADGLCGVAVRFSSKRFL